MKTLYGDKSENCCGFCRLHRVGITPKQLKQRKCLTENHRCKHFCKYKQNEYWANEDARKQRIADQKIESRKNRSARKLRQKAYFENLDQQRACHQPTTKPKLQIARTQNETIIATFDSDIPAQNPFAILATRTYIDEEIPIPPELDELLPYD